MANESVLNVQPLVNSVTSYSYSTSLSGLSATILLNLSATTLGGTLPDEDSKLFIQTSYANPLYTGATAPYIFALSGSTPTSVYFTLSSASTIPNTIQYIGTVSSTVMNTTAANVTFAVTFPVSLDIDNVNLPTTTIYLSGNLTTIVLDPTKSSTVDNFFYASTVPPVSGNTITANTVRTTAGHARLVSYLG